MLIGQQSSAVAVPPAVLRLAATRALNVLWHNEIGGLTYVVGDDLVIKWSPPGVDLGAEADRLAWARAFIVVPEVVDHGRTGLLVHYAGEEPQARDAFRADLTAAVNEVLADPTRAVTMGAAGRARAIAEFSWEQVAAQTVEVYHAALETSRG